MGVLPKPQYVISSLVFFVFLEEEKWGGVVQGCGESQSCCIKLKYLYNKA